MPEIIFSMLFSYITKIYAHELHRLPCGFLYRAQVNYYFTNFSSFELNTSTGATAY